MTFFRWKKYEGTHHLLQIHVEPKEKKFSLISCPFQDNFLF